MHCLRRFQLLVYPGNRIALRLTAVDGIAAEEAFAQAKATLAAYLTTQGVVDIELTLSPEEPRQQVGSSKFKHIVHMAADEPAKV